MSGRVFTGGDPGLKTEKIMDENSEENETIT